MSTLTELSKEIEPRPLQNGQTAIFKLVNAGRIDPATGLPTFNAGATFEGECVIYDKGHKDVVTIKNSKGTEIVLRNGQREVVDKIEPIVFSKNGTCTVKHTEPNKYRFLSRDNRCKTNPFRDTSVEPVWEEIVEQNIRERAKVDMDLTVEALNIVSKGDPKQVTSIAESLNKSGIASIAPESNITDMRIQLVKYAKENPREIIKASKDKNARVVVDIIDAQTKGAIQFVEEENEWKWVDRKDKENPTILKVKLGFSPVNELVNFILNQEEINKAVTGDKKIKTILTEIKETLKEVV